MKLKKCCIRQVEKPTAPRLPFSMVFPTYDELWPRPQAQWAEIDKELMRFSRNSIVPLLIKINIIATSEKVPAVDQISAFLNTLFPEQERTKLKYWITKGQFDVLIPREVAIHALTRALALPEESFAENVTIDESNVKDVGPLLLKIASHTLRIDDHAFEIGTEDDKRKLLSGHMFRGLFFRHGSNTGSSIGRWWAMFTQGLIATSVKYPGSLSDLDEILRRHLDVDSTEWLTGIVGIYAHYLNSTPTLLTDPGVFFIDTGYLRSVGKTEADGFRIMRAIASDIGALSQPLVELGPQSFFQSAEAVYNTPVVRISDRSIAVVDLPALESRLGPGLYWALFNALSQGEKNQLRTTIGHSFEWYVAKLLKETFGNQCLIDWDGEIPLISGVPTPDALILDDNCLFVIEVTTSSPTPATSLSGDWSNIANELRSIWFGRGEKRESAKVLQLHKFLEQYRSDVKTLGAFSGQRIDRVIPILVLSTPLPQFDGLTAAYRQMLGQESLDEAFVRSLLWLDIGEVENLCSHRLAGVSLTSILDAWTRSELAAQSLNNFMIAHAYPNQRHPFTSKWMQECFAQLEATLRR